MKQIAALDTSNKEVMALKMDLPGRPMPTQQLAEERQCEQRPQQPQHQQAERAQTGRIRGRRLWQTRRRRLQWDRCSKGGSPKSLKERKMYERLNRIEGQHNATINAFNERFANIGSALQQIMVVLHQEDRKKAVLQQHLEQTTVRPDVIALQATLTAEFKFPVYKASAARRACGTRPVALVEGSAPWATLIPDPADPTWIGNSVTPNMTPDLDDD
ncbi:hypothetical protein HPB51_022868 [Rhipicephalus microplus]|uniref:Uncharacterized protein n=1 Tax=Rhipicephalus microplus TaxID=6941 RepID=A0A9J6DRB6_RHIMP|nr:hypothetical protein HPB51_022868 [Rhipicephalus microplus]